MKYQGWGQLQNRACVLRASPHLAHAASRARDHRDLVGQAKAAAQEGAEGAKEHDNADDGVAMIR